MRKDYLFTKRDGSRRLLVILMENSKESSPCSMKCARVVFQRDRSRAVQFEKITSSRSHTGNNRES
eukprot:scaffold28378_cov223-Skeletonema_marinoi.AAC.6